MTARRATARRHLSVRNVPEDMAKALDSERRRLGRSLNETVLGLLRSSLRLEQPRATNGIERFAGTWTEADLHEFEEATAEFERIDEDD